MGVDHKFYYDFNSEIPINDWKKTKSEDGALILGATVDHLVGKYTLLSPADSKKFPTLCRVTAGGVTNEVTKRDAVFVIQIYQFHDAPPH